MELQLSRLGYVAGGRVLLQDVSVSVTAPFRVVIRGPSGSGKSTLCRVLAKRIPVGFARNLPVSPYYTGTVSCVASSVPPSVYVGPIPESQLIGSSVADLFLPLTQSIATEHLRTMGLSEHFLKRDPMTLSSGEATRALLSVVLSFSDCMAILDAPWGLIDGSSRAAVAQKFLSDASRRLVIEAESVFLPPAISTAQTDVILAAKSDVGEILQAVENHVANVWQRQPATSHGPYTRIDGGVEFAFDGASMRIQMHEFTVPASGLTWVQGDNGVGKTTLARHLSSLSVTGRISYSTLKVCGSSFDGVVSRELIGYASGRLPLGDGAMSRACRPLISDSKICSDFGDACGNILNPLKSTEWAICPLLVALGSALYQLSMGRRIIFVDEPFSGATEQEVQGAALILRKWAQSFGAAVLIISHLTEPPIAEDDGVLHFTAIEPLPRRVIRVEALNSLGMRCCI